MTSVLFSDSPPSLFLFFTDPATAEIYTLSLHDALPISGPRSAPAPPPTPSGYCTDTSPAYRPRDRKSTRLNSSHRCISYAVFCLKKKKDKNSGNKDDPEEELHYIPQNISIEHLQNQPIF